MFKMLVDQSVTPVVLTKGNMGQIIPSERDHIVCPNVEICSKGGAS